MAKGEARKRIEAREFLERCTRKVYFVYFEDDNAVCGITVYNENYGFTIERVGYQIFINGKPFDDLDEAQKAISEIVENIRNPNDFLFDSQYEAIEFVKTTPLFPKNSVRTRSEIIEWLENIYFTTIF